MDILFNLSIIAPEIILAVGILVLTILGISDFRHPTSLVTGGAIVILILPLFLLVFGFRTEAAFGDLVVHDNFVRCVHALLLLISALVLLISSPYMRLEELSRFEYPILIIFATLGSMIMVGAGNLISFYLGLEMQSLSLYILAAFNRDSVRSTEAGLKYFVLSALSSGFLLYGISLTYVTTGHLGFAELSNSLVQGDVPLLTVLSLVLILVGLVFKISAVPFHMWTPDVYEGAPTPVTAFFSTVPKLAAIAVLLRLLTLPFGALAAQWQHIIIFIAVASMTVGAIAGLGQHNIKRLMAYSSISNIGYALIGLAAGGVDGLSSVFLYMVLYIIMTLGVFSCILFMRAKGGVVERIEDLAGLSRRHPVLAFFMATLLFSLAGIPPLAGFWGKWFVFFAAVEAGLTPLAVFGALASVVAAFYYLRLVKLMYFDQAKLTFDAIPGELRFVLAAAALFVIGITVFMGPFLDFSQFAIAALIL